MGKDVFVCYAKKDLERVQDIVHKLENTGISCWCDFSDLKLGEQWKHRITEEMKKCSYFLVVLSHTSTGTDGFRHKEIKMAIEIAKELSPNKIFILPVLIDDCDIHYEELRDIHKVKLFQNYDDGFSRIINAIDYYKQKKAEEEYKHFVESTYDKYLKQVRRDSSVGFINQQAGKIYRDIFEKNALNGLHKNQNEFDHTLLYYIAGRVKQLDNVYLASKSQDEVAREITDQIILFINMDAWKQEDAFEM